MFLMDLSDSVGSYICGCSPYGFDTRDVYLDTSESSLLKHSFLGDCETVRQLLEAQVDPNSLNSYGSSPLLLASMQGHIEVVKMLTRNGGDVHLSGPEEWTALHAACSYGHVKVAAWLLKKGADVHALTRLDARPGEQFVDTVPYEICSEVKALINKARSDGMWEEIKGEEDDQVFDGRGPDTEVFFYNRHEIPIFYDADADEEDDHKRQNSSLKDQASLRSTFWDRIRSSSRFSLNHSGSQEHDVPSKVDLHNISDIHEEEMSEDSSRFSEGSHSLEPEMALADVSALRRKLGKGTQPILIENFSQHRRRFLQEFRAKVIKWRKEGKDVEGVFASHFRNSEQLSVEDFELAWRELNWLALTELEKQCLLSKFIDPLTGTIMAKKLLLFIGYCKEDKMFVEVIPQQICERSLCYFHIKHPFRQLCLRLTYNPDFQRFILLTILFSSVTLALVDYTVVDSSGYPTAKGSTRNLIIEVSEPIFSAIFMFEAILKIVAVGFSRDENSYLRSGWNILDFFVIITSLIAMLPLSNRRLRVLRIFRVLRPLKVNSKVKGLRNIVQAFIHSFKGIWNVFVIIGLFLYLFVTIGINLFSGGFHARCRYTPFPVELDPSCLSAHDNCWSNYIQNVTVDPDSWRCLDVPNNDPRWDKSSSPWRTPRDCVWPSVTQNYYQRLCSLSGKGAYVCPQGQTCGSNYDYSGNARFLSSPIPYGVDRMDFDIFYPEFNFGFTNFDSFGAGFLAITQVLTLTDAFVILNMGMDSVGRTRTVLYYVFTIFFGNFIMLNLFLGVLTDSLIAEQKLVQHMKESSNRISEHKPAETPSECGRGSTGRVSEAQTAHSFITDDETAASEIEEHTKDTLAESDPHSQRTRLQRFVRSDHFSTFMMGCIIFNIVLLAIDHYPESEKLATMIERLNETLVFIFLVEMVVLMCAHGFVKHIRSPSNVFDALIVLASLAEIVFDFTSPGRSTSAVSCLRSFRIFRLYRLVRKNAELRNLLKHMLSTFKQMIYFWFLLILYVYIFALIAMELFANKLHFDPITGALITYGQPGYAHAFVPQLNFDTFGLACISVFAILTLENWDAYFYYCRLANNTSAIVYFMFVIYTGAFIIMQLVIGILLANFMSPIPKSKKKRLKSITKPKDFLPMVLWQRISDKVTALLQEGQNRIRNNNLVQMIVSNWMRIKAPAKRLSNHHSYTFIVGIAVCISSLCFFWDSPLTDPEGKIHKDLFQVNYTFAYFFLFENLLKMITDGVYFEEDAFFRDPFNCLDFFVTIYSVTALYATEHGSFYSVLRLVKVLRPLRIVSRISYVKEVLMAFLMSLPPMITVVMVCLLIFFICSTFAVSFLKGTSYSCTGTMTANQLQFLTSPLPWNSLSESDFLLFANSSCSSAETYPMNPTSEAICNCWSGTAWTNILLFPLNFNNVIAGMATFFEISTTSSWLDVMTTAVNNKGIGFQPVQNSYPGWYFFFALFICLGNMFLFNVFVGTVVDVFTQMRKSEDTAWNTEAQKEWLDIKFLIIKMIRKRKIPKPADRFREKVYNIVVTEVNTRGEAQTKAFEWISLAVIGLNAVVEAMYFFGQPDDYGILLGSINISCVVWFNFELLMKVVALGVHYFADEWNCLDCMIILTTNICCIYSASTGRNVTALASITRIFRLFRLFHMVSLLHGVEKMLGSLIKGLPGFANIAILLLIVFSMYAVLGVQLFAKVGTNAYVSSHQNFRTFGNALLVLFRLGTGDNWNYFMHSLYTKYPGCMQNPPFNPNWCEVNHNAPGCVPLNGCANGYVVMSYFYSFYLLVVLILINLFVGVVLDNIDIEEERFNFSVISLESIEQYNDVWDKVDPLRKNWFPAYHLPHFLKLIDEPFGLPESDRCKPEEISHLITMLCIPAKMWGSIEYHTYRDVTFALAKQMHRQMFEGEELKHLQAEEENAKNSIQNVVKEKLSALKVAFRPKLSTQREPQTSQDELVVTM